MLNSKKICEIKSGAEVASPDHIFGKIGSNVA